MTSKNGVHRFGTIEEIHKNYINGSLSPVDVINEALHKLQETNSETNAIVRDFSERAISEAKESENRYKEGTSYGYLDGIPITVKDSIEALGGNFSSGCNLFSSRKSEKDAPVISHIRSQGAIVIGKSNCAELTLAFTSDNPLFGPVKNPISEGKDSGGSSSGDAVAVHLGISKIGIASDLAGSLRVPAAWNGVVSLKPTPGIIPTRGHFPDSWKGIAVIGPITSNIPDLRVSLETMRFFDKEDVFSFPANDDDSCFENNKFVLIDHFKNIGLDANVKEVLSSVSTGLESNGWNRVEDDNAQTISSVTEELFWGLAAGHGGPQEGLQALIENINYLGESAKSFIGLAGQYQTDIGEFARSEHYRQELLGTVERMFRNIDFILTVASPVLPQVSGTSNVLIGDEYHHILEAQRFSWVISMLGLPAVTIPMTTKEGQPVGIQIVGPRFSDKNLIQLVQEMNLLES